MSLSLGCDGGDFGSIPRGQSNSNSNPLTMPSISGSEVIVFHLSRSVPICLHEIGSLLTSAFLSDKSYRGKGLPLQGLVVLFVVVGPRFPFVVTLLAEAERLLVTGLMPVVLA